MAYPKEGSRTYAILKMLHEQGPQFYEAIAQRFPTITRKSMCALGSEYQLPRHGAQYGIPAYLTRWFNGEAPEVKPIGEIPVTHVARPFKPLKNHWTVDGSMKGRIAERSFLISGTSYFSGKEQ